MLLWKIRMKYNKKHSFSWWWKRKDSHWMYHWMLKKIVEWMSCGFHFETAFFSYVLGTRLVTWDPEFVSVAWPEEMAKLRSNFISCSHVHHQTWILTIFKQNLSVELCLSLKKHHGLQQMYAFPALGSWSIPRRLFSTNTLASDILLK